MSAIAQDFDRLALLDSHGWTHNNHYHSFLLKYLPEKCEQALEIGCGTGAFARCLAERADHVLALDFSPEMIGVAESRSSEHANIEFELSDANSRPLPANSFDCIASIATFHHLGLRKMLQKTKTALKPGGVLLVLDLFEPEHNLMTMGGLFDAGLNIVAMGASCSLRMLHNGCLRPPPAVRAAWAAHGKHDSYLKMNEVREFCSEILPLARVRRHLLWRYSIVWKKV
jgi:ubiquinone/menaquinone biosynthesis C-methylase UbiE